jgi:prophage regulatory protein
MEGALSFDPISGRTSGANLVVEPMKKDKNRWRPVEPTLRREADARVIPKKGDRVITWKELKSRIPYSRTHIARLEKLGLFPRRIKLGRRRTGWWESEIDEWLASRPRKT